MFVSIRNSIGWENITRFQIWLSIKNGISRSESGKNKSCSRKGCWRIEKTLRHSQGTTAGAAFKGNDVRQTVFWGNFEIHFWRYRFPMRKYFCFLKVMTMNHAHSSVRTQRSAYRAWPVVVQVNNVRSQLLSGVLTAISSIWVGCRTSVSETA